jgi:hypothetical protein
LSDRKERIEQSSRRSRARFKYEEICVARVKPRQNLHRIISGGNFLRYLGGRWHRPCVRASPPRPAPFTASENGKTQYPVVADPGGTEINQVYLKYTADSANGIYGRQRINYSNQRFVGDIAWRQNEQTFDGLRGNWQALDNLNLDYSYSYRVLRVFGPDDGTFSVDRMD